MDKKRLDAVGKRFERVINNNELEKKLDFTKNDIDNLAGLSSKIVNILKLQKQLIEMHEAEIKELQSQVQKLISISKGEYYGNRTGEVEVISNEETGDGREHDIDNNAIGNEKHVIDNGEDSDATGSGK